MARKIGILVVAVVAVAMMAVAFGGERVGDAVVALADWDGWRDQVVINTDGTVEQKLGVNSPEGTWWGRNSMGEELILTIIDLGGGRYTVNCDGVNGTSAGYGQRSSMRGELLATGSGTYRWNQIGTISVLGYVDSEGQHDSKALPVIVGVSGNLQMNSYSELTVVLDHIGVYNWGSVPFRDQPLMTYPPCTGHFKRMLNDLW